MRGLTQMELSELSGVHRRTIQEWERGRISEAKLKNLTAVAEALECAIEDLFEKPANQLPPQCLSDLEACDLREEVNDGCSRSEDQGEAP